jgi:Rieske Fe-S protein
MTIAYFATYLFSLWAFDALIAAQALVLFMALFSRVHVRTLSKQSERYSAEFSASRRQFLYAMMAFAGLVGLASVFSVLEQSRPALPTTPPAGLPAGVVGNVNQLTQGSPSYFEFPVGSGLPNILLKKSDQSVIGLSMLCTHVCCQLSYDSTLNQLYCPCHGSLFDENGNVVQGPAQYPLPTVTLIPDASGNLTPVKVNGYSPCSG